MQSTVRANLVVMTVRAMRAWAPCIWAMTICSGIAACSSRDVPATWPEQAPASPRASAAPIAMVTQALDGHPPLPGEAHPGWAGLDPSPAQGHEHQHEHASGDADPARQHPAGHHPADPAAAPDDVTEDAVVYTCPMHPDVVSDQPGKCPRCGMNLVKRDAPK
jgi:heavy metal-binding protein